MQQRLFHDSWLEAIAEDIKLLGGRKVVAPKLFTDCDEETAQDRMKCCLSSGHTMEFKPAQVLKIKQWSLDDRGQSCTIDFEDAQLGLRHEVINPADESESLRREVRDLLEVVNRKLDRIERSDQRAGQKRARP